MSLYLQIKLFPFNLSLCHGGLVSLAHEKTRKPEVQSSFLISEELLSSFPKPPSKVALHSQPWGHCPLVFLYFFFSLTRKFNDYLGCIKYFRVQTTALFFFYGNKISLKMHKNEISVPKDEQLRLQRDGKQNRSLSLPILLP